MKTSIQTVLMPILFFSGCTDPAQTTLTSDTHGETTLTTEETALHTGETSLTTTTGKTLAVSAFTTAEGLMVTERTVEVVLNDTAPITVECSAEVSLGGVAERHVLTSSQATLSHTLRLSGLIADTLYSCTTVGADVNMSAEFTTGALPEELVDIFEAPTGEPPLGYMLYNTFGEESGLKDHWLVMQDYWGNIRWYVDGSDGDGIVGLEYEPDAGGILAGGGFNQLYPPSIYDIQGVLVDRFKATADHDIDYRNGNIYFLIAKSGYSCLQRWKSETGKQEWEWCVPQGSSFFNSVAISEDETTALMTTYISDVGVVKLDMTKMQIVWQFDNPSGSGALTIDKPISGLGLQHDVSIVDCESVDHDICFVVYDNGTEERGFSQIVKYGVNETEMSATLLRSFSRKGWYETHSGGVHEMENGNWLITMGSLDEESHTIYLIIDPKNNELWEMKSQDLIQGGYRARHINPCDIFNHTGMCP